MVRIVKKKRSNTWFYGMGIVGVLVGYFIVQWALFFFSSCQGSAVWDWKKAPPGYVCSTTPNFR
ncbi:MAG: hypothetical protein HYX32_02195 [Actinobacteria bacterium]|nr:hypothetical protein [Actinomycetota bacterium]